MDALFDYRDEELELTELLAGALGKGTGGHKGDSAHAGREAGSQPTGTKRGLTAKSKNPAAKNAKRVVCRKGASMHLKRLESVGPALVRCIFSQAPSQQTGKEGPPRETLHVLWSCGLSTA